MGNGGYLTRRARFHAVVGLRQYDARTARGTTSNAGQAAQRAAKPVHFRGRGIGAVGRCAAADFYPFMRVDEVFFFLFA
ncbi:hypothetical protein AQ477_04420 [Burkholderia thailandensis]|nr:hypothetical protein AQ477_04420 [Burkholderia thailandensis]KXF60160.1 hypothetical protein AQ476_01915 [Burkholderia thailandensis]